MKDPFESIRRTQELFDRIYGPIMRQQALIERMTRPFSPDVIDRQLEAAQSVALVYENPAIVNMLAKQQALIDSFRSPDILGEQFQRVMSSIDYTLKSPFLDNQIPDSLIHTDALERAINKFDLLTTGYDVDLEYSDEDFLELDVALEPDGGTSSTSTINWLVIVQITFKIVIALATFVATYPQLKDGAQEILDDLTHLFQVEEGQFIQDADIE